VSAHRLGRGWPKRAAAWARRRKGGEIEPMSLFLFRICFSISQK
jgi:hypothetical protein